MRGHDVKERDLGEDKYNASMGESLKELRNP